MSRSGFAAEHTECEHLLRRQIRPKVLIEVAPDRRCQSVTITALHLVVYGDYPVHSELIQKRRVQRDERKLTRAQEIENELRVPIPMIASICSGMIMPRIRG